MLWRVGDLEELFQGGFGEAIGDDMIQQCQQRGPVIIHVDQHDGFAVQVKLRPCMFSVTI